MTEAASGTSKTPSKLAVLSVILTSHVSTQLNFHAFPKKQDTGDNKTRTPGFEHSFLGIFTCASVSSQNNIVMSMRHEIHALFDDDQQTVATGSVGYRPWILTDENKEYLEALMANLSKGNEHYLATHKQVLGMLSYILYDVLEKKPLDGVLHMQTLLTRKNLKYHVNKYMMKMGYRRSPAQMDHEEQFLEASTRAQLRCTYEKVKKFKPTLESGRFSLTPYGPPLPPKRQQFTKTYSASVAHGLIPYYVRTAADERIFVARDQAAWPSMFY